MHLVLTHDGPFVCNGSHDGVWTYNVSNVTCLECLRTASRNSNRQRDEALNELTEACADRDVAYEESNELRRKEAKP